MIEISAIPTEPGRQLAFQPHVHNNMGSIRKIIHWHVRSMKQGD